MLLTFSYQGWLPRQTFHFCLFPGAATSIQLVFQTNPVRPETIVEEASDSMLSSSSSATSQAQAQRSTPSGARTSVAPELPQSVRREAAVSSSLNLMSPLNFPFLVDPTNTISCHSAI